MPIVPSVTMKASMPSLVIRKPFSMPAISPAMTATDMPKRMIGTPTPMVGSAAFITNIISPAMKAAMEPTDRSSPPAVIT